MKRVAGYLLAVILASPAFAASSINPVIVELDDGQGTVSITNVGQSSTGYEVRALDWSVAEDGTDVLSPTDNLIVFPPLFRLAPGQTLTLRLREVVPPTVAENSYRLEVTEEPPEVAGQGVGLRMQYLASVFSETERNTIAINCQVTSSNSLRVENSGTTRTRLDAVLSDGVDITADVDLTGRALLAQASRIVNLPSGVAPSSLEVDVRGAPLTTCQ